MKSSFDDKKPLVIGMVHFAPLAGRLESPSSQDVLKKARQDLDALLRGGVSAVMFENNYDQPHTERLDKARARQFLNLVTHLTKQLKIPFGLSVLWNDYPTAFRIARKTGADWIRVPVFVDSVRTTFGVFRANPDHVLRTRKRLHAERVRIFADVQVKHATMLTKRSIGASARASINAGADALIVTGSWTGEPPKLSDLRTVRQTVGEFPVLIGSGMTSKNISRYLPSIDGLIVGTDLKSGKMLPKSVERVRTPWSRPISVQKVRQFLRAANRVFRGKI